MIHHGDIEDVPIQALLADDFELHLVNAPLFERDTGCQYEACESDEFCTCQDTDEDDAAA